jgi:hypothetical protein
MQFAMPTAFEQEFLAHFQGRFGSNLMGPGNYTPAGKEYGEPTFTAVVLTSSYAH